jgi:hypothetical protein
VHPAGLQLSREFESSNVERVDWDKYGRVMQAISERLGIGAEDVEAVSHANYELLVISKWGHVLGDERGIFNKRAEVGVPVSYTGDMHLIRDQKGVRGRDGVLIQGFDAGGAQLFELSWGCGGPVSIEDAAAERDRVFAVIQRLASAAASAAP